MAAPGRYDVIRYRRTGRSGLQLPDDLASGCGTTSATTRRSPRSARIVRRAFDLGVTHFDLANNYGPPFGSAEENFGRILASDLRPYRDELVITTKAGWDMWPGPYGFLGRASTCSRPSMRAWRAWASTTSTSSTPIASTRTRRSRRRWARWTTAVQQGKARYVGISSYSARGRPRPSPSCRDLGMPLLIHQPSTRC